MSTALSPVSVTIASWYQEDLTRVAARQRAATVDTATADAAKAPEQKPAAQKPATDSVELTPDQQRKVQDLQNRDLDVRNHEAAHQAAGGSLVGPAQFSYDTGPDQKRYAVGGEVSIDTSREKKPDATIAKMRVVKAAALAPADPSAQDLSVAAKAEEISAQAQLELNRLTSGQGTPNQGQNDNGTTANNERPSVTAQQRRATSGYAQAIGTIISQVTGSGINVSA